MSLGKKIQELRKHSNLSEHRIIHELNFEVFLYGI
ncbi:hypothetical protein BD780_001088 [Clostridium tetanomorphum]|nr:hypothetical protein [Clostridium tetanomorphum]NRS83863.1 hypothetical protein [Clostridium tetanomorphum]NRZ97086.1 hypothetical protein [Clostridium tetanomorphum]